MVAARAIRELHALDPSGFPAAAAEVLSSDPEGPGARFLLALLIGQPDYLRTLCDPQAFTLPVSAALIKQARTLDPMIEVKLAKLLITLSFSTETEADFAARVLDVLHQTDAVTALPALRQLINSSNARVRSKAALLIGRISRNPQWAKLADPFQDTRVAANAVESLWGLETPAACDVFRDAAVDVRNRVAGNGAVGLYLAGDPHSLAILFGFSHSDAASFRNTGAWAMGRTGDPRFLERLSAMTTDPDAGVRRTVARALAAIQSRMKRITDAGGLPVRIHSALCHGGDHEWRVSVEEDAAGPSSPPRLDFRNFVLRSNESPVEEFSVEDKRNGGETLYILRFRTENPQPGLVKVELFTEQGSGEAIGFEMAA